MKKIITYSLFSSLLLLLLFVRCENDEIKLYDQFFDVSLDSLTFVFDVDSAKLPVGTNMTDWNATITSDASWLTIKRVSDSPRNFVVIYPEENLLEEPRYATISLSGGDFAYTVILKQDKFVPPPPPGHKILTNENAGELNTLLLLNEKETITNLKLSGIINYSDMIVMREMILEMKLRHIDLEEVKIVASESYPENTIPTKTFTGCDSLLSIVLPKTLESIGSDGFSYSSGLTSIVLPNSLTELGQGVFYNCRNLEEVTMSSSLAKAGQYQFGNSKLKRLDIPATLAVFDHLYWGLGQLEEVNVHEDHPDFASVDGVVTNKGFDKIVYFPGAKTEWEAPVTITEIPTGTFSSKQRLTKLVLPGVTKINWSSFTNCPVLETVTIDNLEELSDYSFDGNNNNGLRLIDLSKAENLKFVASIPGGQSKKRPIYMTPTLKEHLVIKVASESIKNQLDPNEYPNVVVE